jgi:hypothetical protein
MDRMTYTQIRDMMREAKTGAAREDARRDDAAAFARLNDASIMRAAIYRTGDSDPGVMTESARMLPGRVLRVAGTAPIAPGGQLNNLSVQWPSRVHVLGVAFGVIEGTAPALSALSCRIVKEGSSDLFTDGFTGAYAQLGSLVISGGLALAAWYPLDSYADQGVTWQVSLKNESAAVTATPVVQFVFRDC